MDDVQRILAVFDQNVQSTYELMNFDQVVMDYAIAVVKKLRETADLPYTKDKVIENAVASLENVRRNDSLRIQYGHIANQCVVLLVSYFDSAARDLFQHFLGEVIREGRTDRLSKEEIKMTINELASFSSSDLPNLLVIKKDISFQDMQSISRAFKYYLGFEPQKTDDVNTIIAGHGCRHVIVHAGGVCDHRLIAQVSKAHPRALKVSMELGQRVTFSPDEVERLGTSMHAYLLELVEGVTQSAAQE
jgi:hypothetical protein